MIQSLEEKKKKLQQELEALREEYQVELPKRIAEARALGDLKENAEFHAARERQGFLKARMSQVGNQISQLNEMATAPVDEHKVGFGSTVVALERTSNSRIEFTIVHPSEVDPSEGKISLNSPVGQALQNRTVGEEAVVTLPAGEKRFYIEKITSLHGTVFTA